MRFLRFIYFYLPFLIISSCGEDESPELRLSNAYVGVVEVNLSGTPTDDVPFDQFISLSFSTEIDQSTTGGSIELKDEDNIPVPCIPVYVPGNKKAFGLSPEEDLKQNTQYSIVITNDLKSSDGRSCKPTTFSFVTERGTIMLSSVNIGDQTATATNRILNTPLELDIELTFSVPISTTSLEDAVSITGLNSDNLTFTYSDENKIVEISSAEPLEHLKRHNLVISGVLEGVDGEEFTYYSKYFYTEVDPTPKMPLISDEALLTLVQQQTFKYFYDFAHPTSGMAYERNASTSGGGTVTSGGSGFGIMALIVGMERNFITQQQGLDHMNKIVTFLEGADKFHGAWSHWINGNTGDVIPFSANDNGGDLVETAFLVEGLITFRQYLTVNSISNSYDLVNRINTLWQGVDWEWYRQNDQNVLYWHWSPNIGNGWIMNHQIKGWNECLITYVLAASAPTPAFTIPKVVYESGWASNGGIRNTTPSEGLVLPVGSPSGGPLFFSHYSFVGMNPASLNDQYANYWTQTVNHSLINYRYCVRNPKNFVGYSDECWGLTASDNHIGYSAHSPTNDLGVITPTAALSSFPYTPTESMKALKFFYYTMGDRLWGQYGFYDAFNVTEDWYASSYLAIDQGPIIVMIENYRTGLLWDLFMSAPEVQDGLDKLGFTY